MGEGICEFYTVDNTKIKEENSNKFDWNDILSDISPYESKKETPLKLDYSSSSDSESTTSSSTSDDEEEFRNLENKLRETEQLYLKSNKELNKSKLEVDRLKEEVNQYIAKNDLILKDSNKLKLQIANEKAIIS